MRNLFVISPTCLFPNTMSTELDVGLPSNRQLQNLIQDGSEVEIKVVTNDLLVGKVRCRIILPMF